MQVFEGDAYRSYLYIAFVATLRSFNPEPNNNCSPAMLQHPYYFRIPAGEYLCAAVPERPEIIVEFEMGTMDYHCFPPKLEQRILLRRDHT